MLPKILLIVVNKLLIVGLAVVANLTALVEGFFVDIPAVLEITFPVGALDGLFIAVAPVYVGATDTLVIGRLFCVVLVNEFLTVPVFKNGELGLAELVMVDLAEVICLGAL